MNAQHLLPCDGTQQRGCPLQGMRTPDEPSCLSCRLDAGEADVITRFVSEVLASRVPSRGELGTTAIVRAIGGGLYELAGVTEGLTSWMLNNVAGQLALYDFGLSLPDPDELDSNWRERLHDIWLRPHALRVAEDVLCETFSLASELMQQSLGMVDPRSVEAANMAAAHNTALAFRWGIAEDFRASQVEVRDEYRALRPLLEATLAYHQRLTSPAMWRFTIDEGVGHAPVDVRLSLDQSSIEVLQQALTELIPRAYIQARASDGRCDESHAVFYLERCGDLLWQLADPSRRTHVDGAAS